jgi:hypothetical protein
MTLITPVGCEHVGWNPVQAVERQYWARQRATRDPGKLV